MAKAGQHHNDGLDSAKPRGHEKSTGRNHADRSQEITTGSYKKPRTYAKQAAQHSGKTDDSREQASNRDPHNMDIRERPDTTSGSLRERD